MLDRGTADRLLDGRVSAADAPPGYGPVATLLARVSGDPTSTELAGEPAAVARFRREFVPAHTRAPRTGVRSLVAAGVASVVLVTGALSAAAAGILPAPAQRLAHTALADAGISVPDAPMSSAGIVSVGSANATDCTQTSPRRCPTRDDNHGTAVCTVASDGTCRDNHGTTVCTLASGDRCRDGLGKEVCTVANKGVCHGAASGSTSPDTAPSTPPSHPSPSASPSHPTGPPDTGPTNGTRHTSNPTDTTAPTDTPPGHGHGSTKSATP